MENVKIGSGKLPVITSIFSSEEAHESLELIFSILCGVFLVVGFGLSFSHSVSNLFVLSIYGLSYFFGGFFTTKEAAEDILSGKFEIDFLMLLAAIGCAVLGKYAEGAWLLFLFTMGHSLEHYAMKRARRSVDALTSLVPKTAIVRRGNADKEVPVSQLLPGDRILVKPNTTIAADGVVVKGESFVNQAYITGESMPAEKLPVLCPAESYLDDRNIKGENKVFAGTINGSGTLEFLVTRLAKDSTLSRLIQLVEESESQKSPTQLFTDRVQRFYVPAVLIAVLLLMGAFLVLPETFSSSFYRSMSFLVAASPCALAISTPAAVLSAIARAAKGGVLFKGGAPLEVLGKVDTIAFDKTGTLTKGRPAVTAICSFNGFNDEQVLEMAVALEKLSDHPLADAIVRDGETLLKRKVLAVSNLESFTGKGVRAIYHDAEVVVGNLKMHEGELEDAVLQKVKAFEDDGNTTVFVYQDKQIAGVIALKDVPRPEAPAVLKQLRRLGVEHLLMLTGDNQGIAQSIARDLGISKVYADLLPGEKVDTISNLIDQEQKVAMIGDGVNDAPAMAKSNVSIAMGAAGSDVAIETAEIALMADNLKSLPFAIGLSRKTATIVSQNFIISIGMMVILVPLTLSGSIPMGIAVFGHEGSTLLVVLNALRLLSYRHN